MTHLKVNIWRKILFLVIGFVSLVSCWQRCSLPQSPLPQSPPPPSPIYPQFPFPVPKASAIKIIPRGLFTRLDGEIDLNYVVNSKLLPALDKSGYEYSFYCVKDSGLAIVTRIEKINPDGTPEQTNDRYQTSVATQHYFSLSDYLKSLFRAKPGYYRVIVFLIGPYPIIQSNQTINKQQADSLFSAGADRPYQKLLINKFSSNYQCTALIYEFIKPNEEDAPNELLPSNITCEQHLEKSGIWPTLQTK